MANLGNDTLIPQKIQTIPQNSAKLGKRTKFNSDSEKIDDSDFFRYKLSLLNFAQKHLPTNRIRVCFNNIQHGKESVNIVRTESSAKFKNLMTCSNVWLCPICASRIMSERAKELKYVIEQARRESYHIYMLTFTLKHELHNPLESLLKQLKKAYALFWGGREGLRLKKELTYVGSVKAVEVRYSFSNGYHPHIHILIMTDSPLPITIAKPEKNRDSCLPSTENTLKNRWIESLARVGASASYEHGLDIRESESDMFEYLTKASSLNLELTNGESKKSHYTYSMMQLLDLAYTGDESALFAWLEYSNAIKGTNALVYSDGLKELADSLREINTDESPDAESGELYAKIPRHIWHIVKRGGIEAKSTILRIARDESVYHLALYLHDRLGVAWLDAITIYPDIANSDSKAESVMCHYPHIERKTPMTILDHDLIF